MLLFCFIFWRWGLSFVFHFNTLLYWHPLVLISDLKLSDTTLLVLLLVVTMMIMVEVTMRTMINCFVSPFRGQLTGYLSTLSPLPDFSLLTSPKVGMGSKIYFNIVGLLSTNILQIATMLVKTASKIFIIIKRIINYVMMYIFLGSSLVKV